MTFFFTARVVLNFYENRKCDRFFLCMCVYQCVLMFRFFLFIPFNYNLLFTLGVCEVGGSLADGGAALVIADIPGLVEGAHMVSQGERESQRERA